MLVLKEGRAVKEGSEGKPYHVSWVDSRPWPSLDEVKRTNFTRSESSAPAELLSFDSQTFRSSIGRLCWSSTFDFHVVPLPPSDLLKSICFLSKFAVLSAAPQDHKENFEIANTI